MKSRYLLIILTLIALAFIAYVFNRKSITVGQVIEHVPKSAKAEPPAAKESEKHTDARPLSVATDKDEFAGVLPSEKDSLTGNMMVGNLMPYRTTVLRLVQGRPDLGISRENAEKLQAQYTRLCLERERLEASLAKAIVVNETTSCVEIPAYADQGNALLADLMEYINTQFGHSGGQQVSAAVIPLFLGDNNNVGRARQEFVITAVASQPDEYSVTRKTTLIDRMTGQPTITSQMTDNVSRQYPASYLKLLPYFPAAKQK